MYIPIKAKHFIEFIEKNEGIRFKPNVLNKWGNTCNCVFYPTVGQNIGKWERDLLYEIAMVLVYKWNILDKNIDNSKIEGRKVAPIYRHLISMFYNRGPF